MYLATLFGEDTLIEALKLFFGEQKNEFDASYPVVIKLSLIHISHAPNSSMNCFIIPILK